MRTGGSASATCGSSAARLDGRIDYADDGRDCTVGFSARVGRTRGIPIVAGFATTVLEAVEMGMPDVPCATRP